MSSGTSHLKESEHARPRQSHLGVRFHERVKLPAMPEHRFHRPVLDWYAVHRRHLPWRQLGVSAWGILVSEVMLQQTPVLRVLPVWSDWMARWPRPADLAVATTGDAIRAWGRLGYPRRAVRLHQAATTITEQHAGAVPATLDTLLTLPGIGTYTATAVASFAFRQRHTVLDTNVRRVLTRAISGQAHAPTYLSVAERTTTESLLPDDAETAATWAVALMELGALVCTSANPNCRLCPLAELCSWRAAGLPGATQPRARAQRWHGTDRQMRGFILAQLRLVSSALATTVITTAANQAGGTPAHRDQAERCLETLISDALVARHGEQVQLPG